MNRGFKERQPGPEAETCSRALSQARVYIEQIRSRVSVGGPNMQSGPKSGTLGAKRDYLVDAAKQIRLALERDVGEDYEAAFNHYKNGVDLLLGGIQVESNKERREAVKRKVAQYLKRAEEIFNSHLQKALGNGLIATEGYSSLRFRPIRNLSYPIENLRMCKVVGIIDKVQLVQDPCTGETFVLKSLPKSLVERRGQQTIIPQGISYMVKLVRYYVSEDSIFLQLQHVQGGKLWSHLRRHLHPDMERGKEYPECSSPFRKSIKLKNSYTTPSMSSSLEQEGNWWQSEDKNTCEKRNEASEMQNVSSTNLVHPSLENGQNSCCTSVSWDEQTSQSASGACSDYPSVVGHAVHNNIPNCTVCIGPVNFIREAPKQKEAWWSSAQPTSLAQNSSCLSQRFPTRERSSVTSTEPDLWSPESQTLLDGFRNLQAKIPSLDQHCVNGLCTKEEISMTNGEQRVSPVVPTIQRTGSHAINSKVIETHTAQCNVGKAPAAANIGKGLFIQGTPLACTDMVTDLHTKSLNGKETQKIFSGSVGVVLQPHGNQETQSADEPRGMETPAPLDLGKGKEPSLGSPDASPDIEVDGWCFVSAPPLSETEPRRGSLGTWGLPEQQICQWAAEILLALEGLHQQGVICQDLNPRNILLDNTGHICLTYFGQWPEVEPQFSNRALEELYTAPEVCGITEVTEACDWWSFGALLYELLTGMPLRQNHPSGIHAHTRLHLPDNLSCAAGSLLTELLQCDPESRLGSGVDGINQIKSHPFFRNIQWNQLL